MLSRVSYFFCALLMLYASFSFYPKWEKRGTEATISWDVSGYYWYLPSVFIYHDIKHQSFRDSVQRHYLPTFAPEQMFMHPSGNYVMKYSSGMAVMYLPFFTVAHIAANVLGYPADGFSKPYQLGIQIGGILIALIGLWFLRRFLKLFYSDNVVAIVLLLLVVGTNYLNYAAIEIGMSHNWLFTLYAFLLLSTYHFYRTRKIKYAVLIGLLTGLAMLTRPTEIVACLIPLLWGIDRFSLPAIRERLRFFGEQWQALAIAVLCAVMVVSIQLFYWKYATGQWLVYSYQDQGFSWLHPHFYQYTVSFRSGWLTYCPMMVLAFVGVIPFVFKGNNKVMVITFFLINYYIVSAWDIWWYGGRAMIQSYPILLIPVAALIDEMLRRRRLLVILVPFILLFSFMNIWFTYAAHRDQIYNPDMMNKHYYMAVAGRFKIKEDVWKLLDDEDRIFTGMPKNKKLLYENNFEDDTVSKCPLPPIVGKHSLWLDANRSYSPDYKFPYSPGKSKWLRAEATFRRPADEWDIWQMAQFNVKYYSKGKEVKLQMIRIDRFMHGVETKTLCIDVKDPVVSYDSVGVLFYNGPNNKQLQVDDLKVWGFDD